MEKTEIPVMIWTNQYGWQEGTFVRFTPKRVMVRLLSGRVISRHRSQIQMSQMAKAMAIAEIMAKGD